MTAHRFWLENRYQTNYFFPFHDSIFKLKNNVVILINIVNRLDRIKVRQREYLSKIQ